jgi:hypothetical protein
MNKFMGPLLGMFLLLSGITCVFAQDEKESIMSGKEKNVEVILKILSAIERRDAQRAFELFHPDIEFHWPLSLPYGGTSRGLKLPRPTWVETWDPLQPTDAERRMDPRVVAANEEEVVVLWRQRGVFQASIARASRSRARRVGRCSDHPSPRNTRQTWPGWCRTPSAPR